MNLYYQKLSIKDEIKQIFTSNTLKKGYAEDHIREIVREFIRIRILIL